MIRALVLNAAASWAAFQVGALRHLVTDRRLHFDVHVGTGIGAMHAAFVACGEMDALTAAWQRMGLRRLVRPNVRHPWRDGPLRATPQRRFVAAHVSEARLKARGTQLVVAVVDMRTGEIEHLVWPGCEVPLVDGLMAAVATPGLVAPLSVGGRVLAEATTVDAVPLRAVLGHGVAGTGAVNEVVAVLAALPAGAGPPRRYETWRAVGTRAVAVNLAHDVDAAVDEAQRDAEAAAAFGRVDGTLAGALGDAVDDADLRRRLLDRVDRYRAEAAAATPGRPRAPRLHVIRPTQELAFPLWRFRDGDLTEAYLHGDAVARSVLDAVADVPPTAAGT